MQKSRLYFCVRNILIAILVCAFLGVSQASASPIGATNPANTIRIGGNFDLSGRYAYFGEMVVNGIKLAFKQTNDAGGVLGSKIEFVPLDNASDKAKAAVVMKSLVARGNVSAVLGCLASSNTEAAYIIAEQNRMPLISPTASGFLLQGADGKARAYAFQTCLAAPMQADVMARFAYDELGVRTAAIIYKEKLRISRSTATVFEQVFKSLGGTIVAKAQVGSGGEASQEYLSQIIKAEPEVLFISLDYREAGLVIRSLRENNVRVPLLGTEQLESQGIVAYAGEEALNDVYYFGYYANSNKQPKVKAFLEAYEKEYKRPVDIYAAMGYEAAVVLVEAIRKAGSADPESIRTALEGIEVEGLLGTIHIDQADHNVKKSVIVVRRIEGQALAYKMYKP